MAPEKLSLSDELIRAVEILGELFTARSVQYAVVGGLAATMRGRPRFTQDVDILLEVPQLALPGLLEDLASRGFSFDMTTVIREFVREHITAFRFGNVRIDWLKPVLPLYSRTLAGATEVTWTPGHEIRVASPEGLILTKMVAFRPQDQADITAVLAANRDSINVELIRKEWSPYAPTESERTKWLEAEIARIVPGK